MFTGIVEEVGEVVHHHDHFGNIRKSEQDAGDVAYRRSILFIPVMMGGSREMRAQRWS